MREYTDDELIARAIENGWEWHEGLTGRWPGRGPKWPFTGWKMTHAAVHVTEGKEYIHWEGTHPNRVRTTRIQSKAERPREAFSHEDRCGECGKWIEYDGMFGYEGPGSGVKSREFCWTCNHWLTHVAKYTAPDPRHERAVIEARDGRNVYTIGTATRPSSHNGYGGHWFTIRFHDGTVRRTCDLWCGGPIPERFLDRIPVNAEFIQEDQ